MRARRASLSLCLAAVVASCAAACADLPEHTVDSADVNDTTRSDAIVLDVGPAEVAPPDPCRHVQCATPWPSCDEDGTSVMTPTGASCAATPDGVECQVAGEVTACGPGAVCAEARCYPAGDPCAYAFSPEVALVTRFALGDQARSSSTPRIDACCSDLDGDGTLDDGIGMLLATAAALLGFDANDAYSEAIGAGRLALAIELVGAESLVDDDDVEVRVHEVVSDGDAPPADGTPSDPSDIDYRRVTPDAGTFRAGTASPRSVLGGGRITHGVLSAGGPGSTLRVWLPIGDVWIDIELEAARIEGARVERGLDGIGVRLWGTADQGAKLSGVVSRRAFAQAIGRAAARCDCIALADEVGLVDGDAKCHAATSAGCNDEPGCRFLAAYCSSILILATGDIDGNGDGDRADLEDVLSFGAWLGASPALVSPMPGCPEAGPSLDPPAEHRR